MCSPMCRCFLGKYCDIPKKNTKFSERTPHFFYYFKVIFWLHECLRHKRANAAPKLCHVEADGAKSSATDRHIVVKKVSHVGCHVWPKECWARLRGVAALWKALQPSKSTPKELQKTFNGIWKTKVKDQKPAARPAAIESLRVAYINQVQEKWGDEDLRVMGLLSAVLTHKLPAGCL